MSNEFFTDFPLIVKPQSEMRQGLLRKTGTQSGENNNRPSARRFIRNSFCSCEAVNHRQLKASLAGETSTLIIPISACGADSQNTHYFAFSQKLVAGDKLPCTVEKNINGWLPSLVGCC